MAAARAPRAAPRVTVVVVNYNSGELLRRCVDGLLAQTYAGFEVIVVDNGSEDGSLDRLGSLPPAWSIVPVGRNLGFAAANNLAIARSEAEWVALLNPDAIPERDWLDQLVAAADANAGFDFFACRMLVADATDVLDGAGDAYHMSGLVWRKGHGKLATGRYPGEMEVFSPCAGAALYRRTDVQAVGGFDEDFFCYVEDVDLGFRLRLAGHRCLYVPRAVVHHVGSATAGKHSHFQLYHGHRNLVWTFVKNMPAPLLLLYLPLHLLLNLVAVIWFAARGRGRVILRSKWDAIRGIPAAWRKRGPIQRERRARWQDINRVLGKGLPYEE